MKIVESTRKIINDAVRIAETAIEEVDDHCTLFWDVWRDIDISGCCIVHDEMYEDPNYSRMECDLLLRD